MLINFDYRATVAPALHFLFTFTIVNTEQTAYYLMSYNASRSALVVTNSFDYRGFGSGDETKEKHYARLPAITVTSIVVICQ